MVESDGRLSQIDHVVVSCSGVFVIETKNYRGCIYGMEYGDSWTREWKGRREKIQNPVKQNYGHILALRPLLRRFGQLEFFSIVAFTTKAEIRVDTETQVCFTLRLKHAVKKHRKKVITPACRDAIYDRLISLNVDSVRNRRRHIGEINRRLEREHMLVGERICPRCGSPLIRRRGKHGEFWGCSAYPDCRFTARL